MKWQGIRKKIALWGFLVSFVLAPVQTLHAEEAANAQVPIVKTDRIETTVSSTEELQAAVQNAIQSHASTLYLKDGRNSYEAAVNLLKNELYAPIHTYEGATIFRVGVATAGKDCSLQMIRMSTVEEENAVDLAVLQYLPALQGLSQKDQVVAVHDFICRQVNYSNETLTGQVDFRSAYDGLASGQGVCTTYALLFQKFMDGLGIPCYVATGNVKGTGHAWNLVQLDGNWYHVDCTWDDQSYGIIYNWCLAGADRMGYASYGGIPLAPISLKK